MPDKSVYQYEEAVLRELIYDRTKDSITIFVDQPLPDLPNWKKLDPDSSKIDFSATNQKHVITAFQVGCDSGRDKLRSSCDLLMPDGEWVEINYSISQPWGTQTNELVVKRESTSSENS